MKVERKQGKKIWLDILGIGEYFELNGSLSRVVNRVGNEATIYVFETNHISTLAPDTEVLRAELTDESKLVYSLV